jgi:hypothetical protein
MSNLNPYLSPILDELELFFDAFPITSEHQIIKHLQDKNIPPFALFSLANSKDLFSAHFLCMHALYHLKNHYSYGLKGKRFTLNIQSIRVERVELYDDVNMSEEAHCSIEKIDPLESYYLNSEHYFETQADEIDDMIKSFWQKYIAQDNRKEALEVLNLPKNADTKMIKARYLQLVQKHHPDKGGCAEMFIKISDAKAILDKAL